MRSTSSWRQPSRSRSARSSSRAWTTRSRSKSDRRPRVVEPGLVAFGTPRGESGDLGVRLERRQERWADERVDEGGVAAASGRVRLERRVVAAQAAALLRERASDRCVAFLVKRADVCEPVGTGLGTRGEEGTSAGGVARGDVDVSLGRVVAELGEPEAAFADQVDREAIATGRDRAA